MVGSGAIVVCAEGRCMLDMALNATRFYRNESCGKCVPCRVGSQKLVEMLKGWTEGRSSNEDMQVAGRTFDGYAAGIHLRTGAGGASAHRFGDETFSRVGGRAHCPPPLSGRYLLQLVLRNSWAPCCKTRGTDHRRHIRVRPAGDYYFRRCPHPRHSHPHPLPPAE